MISLKPWSQHDHTNFYLFLKFYNFYFVLFNFIYIEAKEKQSFSYIIIDTRLSKCTNANNFLFIRDQQRGVLKCSSWTIDGINFEQKLIEYEDNLTT